MTIEKQYGELQARIRTAITETFRLVRKGEATEEVEKFVNRMSEDHAKFWLYGFFTALCKQKFFVQSEFYISLSKIFHST